MDISTMLTAFNARRQYLGLTHQQLADRLGKDVSTVKKQLSPGNPGLQLQTAMDIAEALEGKLMFITEESMQLASSTNVDAIRMKVSEIGNQNERLREKLNDKDEIIAGQRERIAQLQDMLYRLQLSNDAKDRAYQDIVTKMMDKI